jgi:hypothetical protein
MYKKVCMKSFNLCHEKWQMQSIDVHNILLTPVYSKMQISIWMRYKLSTNTSLKKFDISNKRCKMPIENSLSSFVKQECSLCQQHLMLRDIRISQLLQIILFPTNKKWLSSVPMLRWVFWNNIETSDFWFIVQLFWILWECHVHILNNMYTEFQKCFLEIWKWCTVWKNENRISKFGELGEI